MRAAAALNKIYQTMSYIKDILTATSILLLIGPAYGGPYTDSIKITQFCTTSGTEMGELAYETGSPYFISLSKAKAEIDTLEKQSKRTPKDENYDSGDVKVTKSMLRINKGVYEVTKKSMGDAKTLYLDYVSNTYGKNFRKLGDAIWIEVSRVDSEERVSELSRAVCMDYFIGK